MGVALTVAYAFWAVLPNASWDAGLRAEGRTQAAGSQPGSALELSEQLEIDPRLGLQLTSGTTRLDVAYLPRLVLQSPAPPSGAASLLHRGELVEEWQTSRTFRLTAREEATWGVSDFSPFQQTVDAGSVDLQPVPAQAQKYVQLGSSAGFELDASRRLKLRALAGYQMSGGADPASRTTYPLQHGPELRASSSWVATRLDSLVLNADGSYARFSNDRRVSLVEGSGGWRRQMSRTTQVDAEAGAAWVRAQDLRSGTERQSALPLARASLTRRLRTSSPLEWVATARLAPFVDRLSGTAYERAELDLAAGWEVGRGVALGAWAGAATSVDRGDQRGERVLLFNTFVSYALTEELDLSGGLRGSWQRSTATPNFLPTWGAFAAFAARQRGTF
jgi:hypothetical protein